MSETLHNYLFGKTNHKKGSFLNEETYTKTPVTIEAIKVPRIANVTMAPKFEKKGF